MADCRRGRTSYRREHSSSTWENWKTPEWKVQEAGFLQNEHLPNQVGCGKAAPAVSLAAQDAAGGLLETDDPPSSEPLSLCGSQSGGHLLPFLIAPEQLFSKGRP